MELITVFTPTYNRESLLHRLYDSLVAQDDKDFIWLVIDDGSIDNTRTYIEHLMKTESRFKIEYYYKQNGGLHTGYNEAIKHLRTELCMCCDSDDWLPVDCISTIRNTWEREKGKQDIAGIIGLDFYSSDAVIGDYLPSEMYIDLNELFISGRLVGDKKIVVRSELYKQQKPMETQCGEKNFNPNYYNIVISENYKWISLNKNLCYVEYQEGGMTNGIYKQYLNSPNSFIELRKLYLGLKKATFSFKCRHIIHYDAECIIAKRINDVFNCSSPDRAKSIVLFPFGFFLFLYIKKKGS